MTLAIDPGPEFSAFVVVFPPFEGDELPSISNFGKIPNEEMLERIGKENTLGHPIVIEQIACYGKPVGEDVLETVFWSGRFAQAWNGPVHRIKRVAVKMHLCHETAKIRDSVIRQRLIDMYGGKAKAIGRKHAPGPLYGITKDCWQALALGITFEQTRNAAV